MSLHLSKCHIVGNHMSWLICENASNNAYSDVSGKARGLTFGLSLQLHAYFMYVSNQSSG